MLKETEMLKPAVYAILLASLAAPAQAADDDAAFLRKAAAAKGDVSKLKNWKTYSMKGTFKAYNRNGYSKYDLEVCMQKPDKLSERLEEPMHGVERTVVSGREGTHSSRKAVRILAADEVRENLEMLEGFDMWWKMAEGSSDLKPAGTETIETEGEEGNVKVECRKYETSKGKDKCVYYFEAESGRLAREWNFTVDRTGAEIESYTDFSEYEEFSGVMFALTQNVCQKNEQEDGSFKSELSRRISTDEVALDGEMNPSVFSPKKDPFAALTDPAALAASCAEAFQGRDPNLAEMAQMAMVRAGTKATDSIKAWKASDNQALRHYANLILLRTGSETAADALYLAETYKSPQAKTVGLVVKAVGHAGYCLVAGGKVVIVDAPYQKGLFGVAEPALDSSSISKADLLLFTSSRRTCFDPAEVKAVASKTGARIAGPPPVIELLAAEGVPRDQLLEMAPAKGASVKAQAAGMTVHAFRTRSQLAVHNAYVIEWEGFKTLHMGSTLDFEKLKMEAARDAAVVFLPLFTMGSKAADFLGTLGTIRFLVPTHLSDLPAVTGEIKNKRTDDKMPAFKELVPILPNGEVKF